MYAFLSKGIPCFPYIICYAMERYGWVLVPLLATRNKKIIPVTKKKSQLSGCGEAWVHEEQGPDWLNYVR